MMHCVLIAEENGVMERDYEYTAARDFNDLLNGAGQLCYCKELILYREVINFN